MTFSLQEEQVIAVKGGMGCPILHPKFAIDELTPDPQQFWFETRFSVSDVATFVHHGSS